VFEGFIFLGGQVMKLQEEVQTCQAQLEIKSEEIQQLLESKESLEQRLFDNLETEKGLVADKSSLEQRLTDIEQEYGLTIQTLSADKAGLEQRLADLDKKHSNIIQNLSANKTDLERRLAALEQEADGHVFKAERVILEQSLTSQEDEDEHQDSSDHDQPARSLAGKAFSADHNMKIIFYKKSTRPCILLHLQ
jgi:chromosome segregation ATPase